MNHVVSMQKEGKKDAAVLSKSPPSCHPQQKATGQTHTHPKKGAHNPFKIQS
jgi:hypothetical protein